MEALYEVKRVTEKKEICVTVPGSKSITNRALLLAALSDGCCTLENVLFSDDSRHFIQALIDLGFETKVEEEQKRVTITGCSGQIPCAKNYQGEFSIADPIATINVGSAGTAARFLTAFLGLSKGYYRIDASEQMKKRPMKELLVALEEIGAQIRYEGEEYHFPLVIGCPEWKKHKVTVDVEKSSQFLSALLISSVLAPWDFKIQVIGNHGMAYVDMTVVMMMQFGVDAGRDDKGRFVIAENAHYEAMNYTIEPDLSAACYFYAMSPLLGVKAKVKGVQFGSLQGDVKFLEVLYNMGCTLQPEADGVLVLPPEDGQIAGGYFDLSAFSDQALTLAALAPFCNSTVQIAKVGHIRMQECNRIEAILQNLEAMGIQASEDEGTITIEPGQIKPATIETFEDHRVAMAFTLCGLVADGIVIKNPGCCKKTFENYYTVLEEALY